MLTPDRLLPLWLQHRDALEHPVETFSFPRFGLTFEDEPHQMGVINLSRDSSYRETICHTLEAALYRGRRMAIEGASMIDIGAEASAHAEAEIVSGDKQAARLVPVIEALAAENLMVSVDTYHADVARAGLEAGAGVINLTGRIDDPDFYRMVADHEAGVILCYTPGDNARSTDKLPPSDQLMDEMLAFFRERIDLATSNGVTRLWVDPGFGFALNLPDGPDRIRYQTESILNAFRLRVLGWPVCVTLASSVYLWRDEARVAEASSATMALLSKANLIRSHEVARVRPVIDTLAIASGR